MDNQIQMKKLDIFLDANPQALKKMQDLANSLTQFPNRQRCSVNI